jgi:nucleotide-binding universal stress UspA family protein
MGTRGLSDWDRLVVGSVAHRVVLLADLPVLIVR